MSQSLSPSHLVFRLTRAGLKRLNSTFRGLGMMREHRDWQARADVCSRCPLTVIENRRAYCGKPFLKQVDRDEAQHGCGCPIFDKAKDPTEHCPRNRQYTASSKGNDCDCAWCVSLRDSKRAA